MHTKYGLKELFIDLVKGDVPLASKELKEARLKLCYECPYFAQNMPGFEPGLSKVNSLKCTLCGCYMPVKAGLEKAVCPKRKW